MKITNNFNLPQPIYQAVSGVWKPRFERITVSQLIQPPLQKYLTIKHWDTLEDDASNRLWALLGQGFHYVLAKYTTEKYLAELPLEANIYGIEVAGRLDLYYSETIEDYKVVSTFSFSLGEKIEWERQLNVYAFLMRHQGFNISKLRVNAILRDWMASRIHSAGYPPIPFQSVDVKVWSPEEAQKYVQERVRLFQENPQSPCSDEDRWIREGKFAVTKAGNKRALRLWDTEEEVQRFLKEYSISHPKIKLIVTKREPTYVKCDKTKAYCPVRFVCPLNTTPTEEEEDAEER